MNLTFAERNPVVLGLVTAALIVAGTIGALAVQGGLFQGGYMVEAHFADAAGLRPGDQVLIAGIRAGQVESMEIEGDHVMAVLRVDDYELPRTSRARIMLRTLVGRRSVELVASDDWSQLLEEGDVIPVERTSLPVDVPEFGEVAEELFRETNVEAVDTFLASLTEMTRGQRAQLEALIQGGTRVAGVVSDQEEEVRNLFRRLRTVSEALASRDQQLVGILDDFGRTVNDLAARREELRRLLVSTNRASAIAADIVGRQRASLDRVLDEVAVVTEVLNRHQLGVAEALAYSGDAIEGFASIAYTGPVPVPWGNVFTTSLGPAGIDAIAGCAGLIDRQLDEIVGEDPRSCEEQANDTFPDDVNGEQPQGPGQETASRGGVPQRLPLAAVAWRALGGEARR